MAKEGKQTADAFALYQKSLASRLRYEQAQQNLKACHDLNRPLRVLDAAGGNGINAEFCLRQGHEVTLLDADPAMLEQARQRLAEQDLLGRCHLLHGSIAEVAEIFPPGHFDLVLCHHVLEYTADARQVLAGLAKVTAPGGELSLITLNPVSEVTRAITFRRDPALAVSKLTDLSYDAKWFGQAQLYPLEQITAWAGQTGWSLKDFRGIRVLADYLPEEQAEDREEELMRLEQLLAGIEPYRRFGRYLQFSFKKEAA